MSLIFIRLLIIFGALWAAARSIYEPQQHRRSIEAIQEVQAGNLTDIPLSRIGFTQDNISPDIHNNSAQLVPMQTFIDLARKDPRGPEAYLREAFPGRLTIFQYENVGLLSLDNRRLYLYKTLAPDASIPVEIVTAEQAGTSLIRGRKISAQDALKERVTTKNGGKSIEVRPGKGKSNDSGAGSSKKPPQTPGTFGTQGSSNKPGTSGTQGNSSKSGSSKPGSSGTQGGSSKPGSSKPGGSSTTSQGGSSKSSGSSKKQGGSRGSRRPKRQAYGV